MNTLAKFLGVGALAAAMAVPSIAVADHRDDERALRAFGAVVGTIARHAQHDRYRDHYYYGGPAYYQGGYYGYPAYAPPPVYAPEPVYEYYDAPPPRAYRNRASSAKAACRSAGNYDPLTDSYTDTTGGRVYC